MKTWENAELVELDINETEQDLWGKYYDGGYIGDGEIGVLGPNKLS